MVEPTDACIILEPSWTCPNTLQSFRYGVPEYNFHQIISFGIVHLYRLRHFRSLNPQSVLVETTTAIGRGGGTFSPSLLVVLRQSCPG